MNAVVIDVYKRKYQEENLYVSVLSRNSAAAVSAT